MSSSISEISAFTIDAKEDHMYDQRKYFDVHEYFGNSIFQNLIEITFVKVWHFLDTSGNPSCRNKL
jgi:hypothetical protein